MPETWSAGIFLLDGSTLASGGMQCALGVRRWLFVALFGFLAACSTTVSQTNPAPTRNPTPTPAGGTVTALPAGSGRALLLGHCSVCHALEEVVKFKGYYDAERWRQVISTMQTYGVQLPEADADMLVDYLAENFGVEGNK